MYGAWCMENRLIKVQYMCVLLYISSICTMYRYNTCMKHVGAFYGCQVMHVVIVYVYREIN